MEHFTIYTADPKQRSGSKVPAAFQDTFVKLAPGTAFAFPVDKGLKDPLGAFKRFQRSVADKGAKFRWEHDGDGNRVVYRVK